MWTKHDKTIWHTVPSGNLTVCYWTWAFIIIYSGSSHWTWWIFPVRYVNVYQRVNPMNNSIKPPNQPSWNHHVPMVFLWFSYGFPSRMSLTTAVPLKDHGFGEDHLNHTITTVLGARGFVLSSQLPRFSPRGLRKKSEDVGIPSGELT